MSIAEAFEEATIGNWLTAIRNVTREAQRYAHT